MRPGRIVNWFGQLYRELGLNGCSSHSGRRTFITNAARLVFKAGGSLRDVQQLAGHRSIEQTQTYIDDSARAKRRLIALLLSAINYIGDPRSPSANRNITYSGLRHFQVSAKSTDKPRLTRSSAAGCKKVRR